MFAGMSHISLVMYEQLGGKCCYFKSQPGIPFREEPVSTLMEKYLAMKIRSPGDSLNSLELG